MTLGGVPTRGPIEWLLAAALAAGLAAAAPGAVLAQSTLSALQTDVDAIASRARPSVLTVYAQRTVSVPRARGGSATGRLHTRVGSGVAIDENTVLTTASVVLGAERVVVRTINGLQVGAQLAGLDPVFNLALLRVPELRLPPLKLEAGRPVQIGDWVIALGTSYRGQPTQSVGTVAYRYREPRFSLLQLTNTVYPGNSGGAALNTHGDLIGLVEGDLGAPELGTGGPDSERRPGGMSFVLPIETILPVVQSLQREGRVAHGYLGVSTRVAVVESDTQQGLRVPIGALVERVVPQSPADRLGLRSGDLIVAFDHERVEYPEQLARWVAGTRPGAAVDLVWVREEIQRTGRAALSESPEAIPEWAIRVSASDNRSPGRIAELERQIQRLNRELELLKLEGAASPR